MRIAIVHDWLVGYAGGERVLEQMIACYPSADLFTIVDFLPPDERGFLGGRPVTTSFVQHLPAARRHYRSYLGLMPLAVEQFDLSGYDVVLSSSHAVAKGVITGPDQPHISYVHSPMRYAWDQQHQYLRQTRTDAGIKGAYARWQLSRLRIWDARTANGVDAFIANSHYIARRIRKAYRREAEVIAPPVDTELFHPADRRGEAFLVASRQVPYKRVDLVAAAFARMPDLRLVISGSGPEHARVRAAAGGAPNIRFLDPCPPAEMAARMQEARGFVFAGEEDFGIVMAEALASGTPVIALDRGGAREIVTGADAAAPTGVLFKEQTVEGVIAGVRDFIASEARIDRSACRMAGERFSVPRFRRDFVAAVERAVAASRR
ncbi:MAG: glycosyltransferase [Rhodospirillales bacterium]|nr:glycosyltransferase [Rhodospirillales bacterium]